jgi:hypothetical protein
VVIYPTAVVFMIALGHKHTPQDCRFFIDSSNLILKAVILHSGKDLPSALVGHAVYIKECDMNICGDFKIIAFVDCMG